MNSKSPSAPRGKPAEDAVIGKQGGLCNRTACRRPGAVCRHTMTGWYYCPSCARKINEWAPEYIKGLLVEFPEAAKDGAK